MGKRLRKLIGTLFLVTAIVVTQIPVSDVEAEDSSAASDFQMDGTTLVKYNGTSEDVSVSNSVKRIEAEAFADNDCVRRVTLGDSVEVIGARAFSGCDYLESVTVPDAVEVIENAAFSSCPSLKSVSVGLGLKSLGNGAFAGDYSLASVDFDSGNPNFVCDDGAIYNKKGWDVLYQVLAGRRGDSYTMPSSVEKIKPYAFWGDYNLQDVSVSSNVREVPGYAFSNCKNLTEVTVPYSVKNIDMKAFEDCVRLRDIFIPSSVSSIHATAFDGCTKLTVHADEGSYAKSFADTLVLDDIDVSEYEEAPVPGLESVSENSAEEETQILGPVDYYHEVSHMNAMEEEEYDSSVKAKSRVIGQEVYVLVDNAKATVNVGGTGEILGGEPEAEEEDLDTIPGLAGSEDAKGGSFPKYTVVNHETIAAQAYYNEEMTECEIPGGIRRIGEFAYARSGLTSVRIPDGVEEIGYAAFYHCDELTDVVIPASVKEIGVSAFDKTPWLSGWKSNAGESGDFLIVGDGILLAYRGEGGNVIIPGNVKTIGAGAFRGMSNITSVQIPDNVTAIGEAAFEDCENLTNFEARNGLRKICDRAFAGCPIREVNIPASVEQIGLRAFDNEKIKDGVVVFHGEQLPARSYESTATKLYRDAYRGAVFTGTRTAVIPAGVTDLAGTCLSSAGGGFPGVICRKKGSDRSADKNATEAGGVLTILSSNGDAPVAGDTVAFGGGTYTLEALGTGADAGANVEADVNVNKGTDTNRDTDANKGTDTNRDTDVDADANAESAALTDVAAEELQEGIRVNNNSYSIPQDGVITAVMEGGEGSYRIDIDDSEDAKAKIGDVYKSIYGNRLPHSLHAYEITMTELATDVPITGLGKQRVEITMPLPSGVLQENLHVVCLDEDGQLEEVDSRIVSMDGKDTVAFQAAHFSYYGIYHYGSGPAVADVKDGQAVFVSLGKKDASPDTGDHSIHPKYFLCAGLFFASMAMFFYQKSGLRRWKRRLLARVSRKRV